MHIETISGETRSPGGKHANDRLRKRGMIPAVVYGHGGEPELLALSRHDLEHALQHATHVIKVRIDGRETQYLLKDVQYDHLQATPIHADLMRVTEHERVKVTVAVETVGEPHGIHEGGELVLMHNDIEIECPLLTIPDVLKFHVDHLGVGDALRVRDLELPEGVVVLMDPDESIATVRPKRGVKVEGEEEETTEASPAEPELVGRGKTAGADGEDAG